MFLGERFIISLEVKGDTVFLNSLARSVEPDVKNVPPTCRVEHNVDDSFHLVIDCESLSDFRALFTSYFNILSVLIKLYQEFKGCGK